LVKQCVWGGPVTKISEEQSTVYWFLHAKINAHYYGLLYDIFYKIISGNISRLKKLAHTIDYCEHCM